MRIDGRYSARLEQAQEAANRMDSRLKRAMHKHLSNLERPERAALKEALAEALGVTVGTINRQIATHDMPVQIRLLGAIKVFAPDLFHELAGIEKAVLREVQGPQADEKAALRELGRACNTITGEALEILEDGRIDDEEEARLQKLLSELDETKETLLACLKNRPGKIEKLRGIG